MHVPRVTLESKFLGTAAPLVATRTLARYGVAFSKSGNLGALRETSTAFAKDFPPVQRKALDRETLRTWGDLIVANSWAMPSIIKGVERSPSWT